LPSFKYKARDRYGVSLQGVMEAGSQSAVAGRLSEMGYTPISIVGEDVSAYVSLEGLFDRFSRVKMEDLIVFVRQLSSIIDAGVPLLESLDALYDQMTSSRFKVIILKIKKDIESGSSFSDALAKEPKIFAPVFVSMIRAGERAGILSEVLDRLAMLLERDYDNTQKIISATRYPMIVMIGISTAFLIVVTFIIPKFSALYSAFKTDLPLPTRLLLWLNSFISHYYILMIILIALGFYTFKKTIESEKGGMAWDRLMLSVPVIGTLISKLMLSRFARMLAAMLKSGIPVVEALHITKQTVENRVISKVITDIEVAVVQGGTLSGPMKGSRIFPPLAVQMVAIGERAGALENMLNKVADYFDRDADYMIRNLTPLLEPLLILVLASLVLVLALGVFLPMWDIVKFVK